MIRTRNYKFEIFVAFMTSMLVVMLLSTASELRTGIGFGRDLKTIVTTNNSEQLDAFLNRQTTLNREWHIETIREDTKVITISGVESADDFKNAMLANVQDLKILHIATFGSITKLMNNQSFISLYLIAFIGIIFAYFVFRFRFLGFITAYQIATSLIISLFVITAFNLPFTKTLWSTMLLAFTILAVQKHIGISERIGARISSDIDKRMLFKRSIAMNLMFAAIALTMFIFFDFTYTINAGFMFLFGLLNFLADLLMIYWGFDAIRRWTKDPEHLVLRETSLFEAPVRPHRTFINLMVLVIGLGVVGFITSLSVKPLIDESADFTPQSVLMIPQSDSNTYLEIQAVLNNIHMFGKQVNYSVSEQGFIWINFDKTVDAPMLEKAMSVIKERTGFDSLYYTTQGNAFPLATWEFYVVFMLTMFLGVALIWFLYPSVYNLHIVFLSCFALVLLVVISITHRLSWSRDLVFAAWSLPLLITSYFSSQKRLEAYKSAKTFEVNYIYTFVISTFMFILVSSPILVVIPITIGFELVGDFLSVFVAIILASIVYFVLTRILRKVGLVYDGDTSSET